MDASCSAENSLEEFFSRVHLVHTTYLSCRPTYGNLMGSNPVTVVANSFHHHDLSNDLGIYDSDTALRSDRNEAALRHAGSTSVVVFVEEHSLRFLAVHLAIRWRKFHLSDDTGKCTEQSVGHR